MLILKNFRKLRVGDSILDLDIYIKFIAKLLCKREEYGTVITYVVGYYL
jgi:uncharacterized protein YebE (UPF0316 family)